MMVGAKDNKGSLAPFPCCYAYDACIYCAVNYIIAVCITVGAPVFIVHPISITIHLSDTTSVQLKCEATEALLYQWERHDGDISNAKGVNSDTLIIENLLQTHGGQYRCIASNKSGATPSNYATLTILGK